MKNKDTTTRDQAKTMMWEYYRDNKHNLPKWIRKFREDLLVEIIQGQDVVQAFEKVIEYGATNKMRRQRQTR